MAQRQLDLGPLTAFSAELEDNLNRFLDDVTANAPPELRDILFESKQSTLGRAIAADLVDIIPIVGDISNFFRVRQVPLVLPWGSRPKIRNRSVPASPLLF